MFAKDERWWRRLAATIEWSKQARNNAQLLIIRRWRTLFEAASWGRCDTCASGTSAIVTRSGWDVSSILLRRQDLIGTSISAPRRGCHLTRIVSCPLIVGSGI